MSFPDLVQPLIDGQDLTQDQAADLMRLLIGGEATEAQIGAVLVALRIKGCTTIELASFAGVMRDRAAGLVHPHADVVDTCGTGGGIPSFNISTAAAIVASASGVRIAKHGNRGVTSNCGSADVLEHLGVRIGGDPDQLATLLDQLRLVFLFAPAHHPAMRHVGKARRELGIRTVFNQLGPLANPAAARRQLIGVFDPKLMLCMGEALQLLGAERALLVHGDDGLDEISPVTTTAFVKVWDGEITSGTLSPADFGLEPVSPGAIAPGPTCQDNAHILVEAISNPASERARAILPSAAAAIWLSGLESDLVSATQRASMAIESGRAAQKLADLVSAGAAG